MVTGCDHVLISSGPIDLKIARFISEWGERWPNMTAEIEGLGSAGRADGVRIAGATVLDVSPFRRWLDCGYCARGPVRSPSGSIRAVQMSLWSRTACT